MQAKDQKYHHAPSVSRLLMAITQTINSLKEDTMQERKCYVCETNHSQDVFRIVNRKFETIPSHKFTFIIENFGLSGLNIPSSFFTDGSINVCLNCYKKAEREYHVLTNKIE